MDHHLYFASCVPEGGIYHYLLSGGKLQEKEVTRCDRPMYLTVDGEFMRGLLRQPFAGSEESGLITYPLNPDKSLGEAAGLTGTKGRVACHLSRFRGKTYAANYLSGSVYCSDGTVKNHAGTGVHPVRQEASHLHFVSAAPDGECLLAVDLGLDTVYVYDEHLKLLSGAKVPAGCGPRHLAFAGDGETVFCVNELDSSVSVFRYLRGRLKLFGTVPVLEEKVPGNLSAAIRVLGDYVYVSNRGDDSISCLEWDGEHLKLRSRTPSGGASPRDFLLVENLLFCANEGSGTVTVFEADGEKLTQRGEKLYIPQVLCIAELPSD